MEYWYYGETIAQSQVIYDSRGLARYANGGSSILRHSDVEPGPEPTTANGPWWTWDDRYYAWTVAQERYRQPAGFVPPVIVPDASKAPPAVIVSTAEAVKAAAVADRRAAGIVDGDWLATGAPVAVVSAVQTSAVAAVPWVEPVAPAITIGQVSAVGALMATGAIGTAGTVGALRATGAPAVVCVGLGLLGVGLLWRWSR